MWIEPKVDWADSDFIKNSDFNRIVNNLKYLGDNIEHYIENVGLSPDFLSIPEKMKGTKPKASEYNAVEDALDKVNAASFELNIGERKNYAPNRRTIDSNELNRIERSMLEIKNKVDTLNTDTSAPTITITSDIGDWVENKIWTLTGSITPNGNGVKRAYFQNLHDGTKVELGSGEFELTGLVLQGGVNAFKIKAFNNDDIPSVYNFTKSYDDAPPTITITSVVDSTVATTYTLEGTVVDSGAGVRKVTINNTDVELVNGTFSITYDLALGDNVYTIMATDRLDKTSTRTVNIRRLDTAGQRAPLSTLVATSKSGSNGYRDYGTYITCEASVHYDGMGVSIARSVTYAGYIDLTKLPDYQHITRVVLQHPRYAEDGRDGGKREWRDTSSTHTVNAGDTKVEFTDYDYRANDSNGASIGADIWARAWAGVRYITYYYG